MGERFLPVTPSDRAMEQAIVALKKGAHILKYGRRGKPKLCPFRLSTDERTLMWFSGNEEKQLRLSSVTSITRGHGNRKLQPEKERHSFSLTYMNNQAQCSLHLICKDKGEADSWFLGLKIAISRSQRSEIQRGARSCVNSPAGFIRRKYNLGILKETKMSQVRSVSGSPIFSDGLSLSSDSFFSESSLSSVHNVADPNSPRDIKKTAPTDPTPKKHREPSPRRKRSELSDVLIWGQGVENGALGDDGGGGRDNRNRTPPDASLPKLLDSVRTLDVENVSLGGNHAALVTKQGEVFCWGDGKGGGLMHNVGNPKVVKPLSGVRVRLVSCGEYQTCAVGVSGELYRWGDDGSGQTTQIPRRVSGVLDGVRVSEAACGEWHTAVVSASGELFTFGDGTFGVLGHGDRRSLAQPKRVESLNGLVVKSAACGPWHTAAVVGTAAVLGPAGKLFTWGDGDKGRLGHVDTKLSPTCVVPLVDHDFVQVACGRTLTVGLTTTGVVYTLGSSVHGQLGNPLALENSVTVVHGKLKFEFVTEIACGSYHVAALTSKGNVYAWGKGANGQLGLGDTEDRSSPTFVEALGRRQVQRITCRSNSTAAVCVHLSITCRVDQSACRGCAADFGFLRKKHNCYNCGLFFCGPCTRRKTRNTCFAPVEGKSFRVCDSCFKAMETDSDRGQTSKTEDPSPRPLSIKPFSEETADHAAVTLKPIKLKGVSVSGSDLDSGAPRWGQVSSPASFWKHFSEADSIAFENGSSREPSGSSRRTPLRLRPAALVNTKQDLLESDRIISREVKKLRAQADSLERLCHTREYRVEERGEETVKHRAAKDVIKALTSRLHLMSPRAAATRRPEKPQANTNRPLLMSTCHDTPTSRGMHRAKDGPRDVDVGKPDGAGGQPEKVGGSCDSALTVYEKPPIRKVDGGEAGGPYLDAGGTTSTETARNEAKQRREWVEQYRPGVYVTFIMLSNGRKGIKRVRFSRKRFTAKEAERWWDENQLRVYDDYDIDGYINSY